MVEETILSKAIGWIGNNLIYIVGAFAIFFFIKWLIDRKKNVKLKPISRSEEERKRFVDRNKYNRTEYKTLFRGDQQLAKIVYLRGTTLNSETPVLNKDNKPIGTPIIEAVVRSAVVVFGIKIPFLWSMKKEGLCFYASSVTELDPINKKITIDKKITFDKFFGIYYDRQYEKEFVNFIKENTILRTDYDNMSAIYYSKAMEQAVFNPVYAKDMGIEQTRLEAEKEKRKVLTS